jgi:hypothetical protein
MVNFLNHTPLGKAIQSYVKTFLAVVLGLFLATGADVTSISGDDVKLWLSAGLAAVLPLIVTALNPNDTRFGENADASIKKEEYQPDPLDMDEIPEDDPDDDDDDGDFVDDEYDGDFVDDEYDGEFDKEDGEFDDEGQSDEAKV